MPECYLCSKALTADNESKEHILLNAIGGQLKSNDLLCRKCNSDFGHEADSELAAQLLFLSGHLNIKRDKGENPIIKGAKSENGKTYNLIGGSKPVASKPEFNRNVKDGKVSYSIGARNEKELIKMLKG